MVCYFVVIYGAAVCKQDAVLLSIVGEEVGEFAHCVTKRLQAWQVDYAEVAWSLPIKAFSVYNQQLLIAQQIKRKLFVIVNVVSSRIELYKHVESGIWSLNAYAIHLLKCIIAILAPVSYTHLTLPTKRIV